MGFDTEKSKSEIKRELLALQELGRELTGLSEKHLVKIPLTDLLREEIRQARGMSRGTLQRQLRYIGGLLPHEDVEAVRQALHGVLNLTRDEVNYFHTIEKTRDALLAGSEQEISEIVERHSKADRQQLRRLVRSAKKEQKENKPPKSARLLFKYLRDA